MIDFIEFFPTILSITLSLIPVALVFGTIFLIGYCFKNHVHIKFRTFKGRGFRPDRGDFGLFVYCGSQGKGKTYSLVEYLVDNSKKIQVFSNISNILNVENIEYYKGFDGLIKIKHDLDSGELKVLSDKQLVIVFDEIFTELQKGDKLSKEVLDFLCQMRKRKIIFLTTAQYWAELPISYRRFCRYQIDCDMFPVLWTGILKKTFHDAENMKWEQEEQDFIAPITETTFTKCRKKIAESYDTFLRISSTPIITQERR